MERAAGGKGGGGDDDEVEEETERGESDESASDDSVDEEEVVRNGVAEEKCNLNHKGQILHNEIEMPGDHPVHLPLSMAAEIDKGSAHFDLGATVGQALQ